MGRRSPVTDGLCHDYNGNWYVVLREPDPATGKTKMVWHSGFRSETEAKAFRDERRDKLNKGKAVKRSRLTVEQYLAEWLPAHAQTRGLAENTVYGYSSHIKNYINPFIGKMRIQDVDSRTISSLYLKLAAEGFSRRTIQYTGTVLRMAFKAAYQVHKIIDYDHARDVPIPSPERTVKTTWRPEQMAKVMRIVEKHELGALFIVMMESGCRREEALGLSWPDIEWENRVLSLWQVRVLVGGKAITKPRLKNRQPRRVPVSEYCMEALRRHRKAQLEMQMKARRWNDTGFVFTNRWGEPMYPTSVYDPWVEICESAGVPYLPPHGLRHTHATWLLESGHNPKEVAERLGHKDVTTTMRTYFHVTEDQARESVSTMDRLLGRDSDTVSG